ncbi:MAG: tetratricopeptide repeat protein [Puniceicoccales bacterium]|jgi:type III secretion system low calcium response chaperone LcrH/SycD|nr:tetratricopeptide repeat protein [Puniceicoccales bacterium]
METIYGKYPLGGNRMEGEMERILREHFRRNPLDQRTLGERFQGLEERHLEAAYAIGQELMRRGKYGKAESIFYFLALMDHLEVRYWRALGVSLWIQKKYGEALGVYLGAYFLDPKEIEVVAAMAECCMALGDREGAKEFLEQTCELFEEEGKREDLARRARVYLEMMKGEKR